MTDRNYEILSGDTLVAVWNNNKLSVVNEALLPLYLKKIQNSAKAWTGWSDLSAVCKNATVGRGHDPADQVRSLPMMRGLKWVDCRNQQNPYENDTASVGS